MSDRVTISGLTAEQVAAIDQAVGFDADRAIDASGVDRWLRWMEKSQGVVYRNPAHKAEVEKFRVIV